MNQAESIEACVLRRNKCVRHALRLLRRAAVSSRYWKNNPDTALKNFIKALGCTLHYTVFAMDDLHQLMPGV